MNTEIFDFGSAFDCTFIDNSIIRVLSGQQKLYTEIGERLGNQRNYFAHGDLDKDFIGLSLLELIYLEYVVYALQLKHYGIDNDCIRKAINDLFNLNFAI